MNTFVPTKPFFDNSAKYFLGDNRCRDDFPEECNAYELWLKDQGVCSMNEELMGCVFETEEQAIIFKLKWG